MESLISRPSSRLAVAALILLWLSACGSVQKKIESRPLPVGISFAGKWYSEQFEKMEVTQAGTTVKGTFSYKGGGTFEGELEGNVLYFEWIQPGDTASARAEVTGSGYFVIADDGALLDGRWGYGEDNHTGGVWRAERVDAEKSNEDFDKPIFGQ